MSEVTQLLVVAPKKQFLPADSTSISAWVVPIARTGARDPSIDHRVGPTPVWQPASTARIHAVETTVMLGMLAYFAYGLGAALGVI